MNHAAMAAALADAERTRVPIPPPSETFPALSVDDAYIVQRIGIERRVAAGARIVGHKVGLTSPAMQRMLGVDEPDFGHLLDTMVVTGTAPVARYLQPRAEVEIAFVLRAPLRGPGVTVADVLAATGHLCAAIEIIDSRVADWRITLADTVADNASSAGVALSEHRVPVDGLELTAVEGRTLVDGKVAERGRGDAVLGHPAAAVAWLADTLGRHGSGLEAGQVVLPGAFARAVPVAAGCRVAADIDVLGRVEVLFT